MRPSRRSDRDLGVPRSSPYLERQVVQVRRFAGGDISLVRSEPEMSMPAHSIPEVHGPIRQILEHGSRESYRLSQLDDGGVRGEEPE